MLEDKDLHSTIPTPRNQQDEKTFKTICNLCPIGCTLQLSRDHGDITDVKGVEGLINYDGTICSYAKTGYQAIPKANRLTQPLFREGNTLEPISWKVAFDILQEKITVGDPAEKAFFAGARLTNEEQYLVMKICRACAYSNNIGSFHYLGRGTSYTKLSRANIPFNELVEAKEIFIIGAEVCAEYPLAGHYIFNNQKESGIPVQLITINSQSPLIKKADGHLVVKSYFHFLKAVNYSIVSRQLEDTEYISNLVGNFNEYKQKLLSVDFDHLVQESGVDREIINHYTDMILQEPYAVFVFGENELSGHACSEIFNLALLTGKHGRTGAGLMLLKGNNNSHGLHDIGVMSNLGPGATEWADPARRSAVRLQWKSRELPATKSCTLHALRDKGYKSMFIFGEDPVGCAIDPDETKRQLAQSDFIMVQDYILTPTAQMANLVLPASMPYETGGTFTNCQRVIQKADRRLESPLEYDSWKQLEELLARCGYDRFETIDDVTFEIAGLLPSACSGSSLQFRLNTDDNYNPIFEYGCDVMHRLAGMSVSNQTPAEIISPEK